VVTPRRSPVPSRTLLPCAIALRGTDPFSAPPPCSDGVRPSSRPVITDGRPCHALRSTRNHPRRACAGAADVNGICILGDVNFATCEVAREVRDVTVSGFTIRGFTIRSFTIRSFTIRGFSEGIVAVGAHNATFERNTALDNEGYGVTAVRR